MTKREQELLRKIEELESRIKALETRTPLETHHHYHYTNPVYHVQPQYAPYSPWNPLTPWCTSGGISARPEGFQGQWQG